MAPKRNASTSAGAAAASIGVKVEEGASQSGQTRTRQAIGAILKVASPIQPDQALLALLELESRQLQSSANAEELQSSHCCCFDTASVAAPTWTSHQVCERCKILNQLLQREYHRLLRHISGRDLYQIY